MGIRSWLRPLRQRISYIRFKLGKHDSTPFTCPICDYSGPFEDAHDPSGLRKHAKCPCCGALERHRVQFLTLQTVLAQRVPQNMRLLHFAPEPFFSDLFRKTFGRYETADLCMDGVDHKVDLLRLPFADASYDIVYASHVLEHILDDRTAVAEIKRILKPGGIAILPVPLLGSTTVEFRAPDPNDYFHVRAPGYDYYERFKPFFARVVEFTSSSFPERYQPFIHEDRSRWPTTACPQRQPMAGDRHLDVVPVCYV